MKLFRLVLLLFIFLSTAKAQDVITYAGIAGTSGFTDGPASSAKFNSPHGVCVDKWGNVFVTDRYNHRIRKIATSGTVSTLAGSGLPGSTDGTGNAATFNEPWAIVCDTSGNLYVADTKSYKIRKVTQAGVVTTLAGTGVFGTTNGPAMTAQFGFPAGIAVTKDGNTIYVADRMTHVIRQIQGGQVTTIAGTAFLQGSTNGTGAAARFDHPYSIALDNSNNIVVADEWNNIIRRVTPAGAVTTIAGNGTAGSTNGNAASSSFNAPWGIAVDTTGNIYVGDGNNYTIRKITPAGIVSTYAGVNGMPGFTNGPISTATFQGITGLAYFKTQHALYAGDSYNHIIRKIAPVSSVTLTITSNASNNTFCYGSNVTLTASPNNLSNYNFMEGTVLLGSSPNGTLTISTLSVGNHPVHCTATDALGYTVTSDTIIITIVNSASASITPSSNVSFCQGDSVMLTASTGISYLWNTGATTKSIYAKSAGSYVVTVTVTGGCSAQSAPVTVTMKNFPSSVQTVNDSVCSGSAAQLGVVPQAGVTYFWFAQPSGGTSLFTGTSFTTPPVWATSSYFVELHGSNGCVNPVRTAVLAIVYPVPSAFFEYALQSSSGTSLTVAFQNTSVNTSAYQWNFGDSISSDNTSTLANPVHEYSTPGEYWVQLIATGSNGCADTLLKKISVSRSNKVFIPTAFTPNNDGQNDVFRVRGSNIESVMMKIYSQWGQMIYESPLNNWDGKVRGDVVQTGTYLYVVEILFTDSSSEKFKGQISVIR